MESINKLNEQEFNSTFIPPMKFMNTDDETSAVDLKLYVESIIESENFNKTIKELTIDSIYHNVNKTFEHVLINYGITNFFLVIVVNLESKYILGYYILDLNKDYAIE